MSHLVDKFTCKYLKSLLDYRSRSTNETWASLRNLVILFEGCEQWINNSHSWSFIRIQEMLKQPYKFVNLVSNYRLNIQKINPKNVDQIKLEMQQQPSYLNDLIVFIINEYDNLENEEQFIAQLDHSSNSSEKSHNQSNHEPSQCSSVNSLQSLKSICQKSFSNHKKAQQSPQTDLSRSSTKSNFQQPNQQIDSLLSQQLRVQQQIKEHSRILQELQQENNRLSGLIDRQSKRASIHTKLDKIINNFTPQHKVI